MIVIQVQTLLLSRILGNSKCKKGLSPERVRISLISGGVENFQHGGPSGRSLG